MALIFFLKNYSSGGLFLLVSYYFIPALEFSLKFFDIYEEGSSSNAKVRFSIKFM